MYDHKLKTDYIIMTKNVIDVIITYILYLNNKNTLIHNCQYTDDILSKNNIYEVDGYRHFLRTKPDTSKTYIYIDNIKNHTYIKIAGIFGDMLLDTLKYKSNKNIKEVSNTLKWLFNNNKNNDILVFNYKKKIINTLDYLILSNKSFYFLLLNTCVLSFILLMSSLLLQEKGGNIKKS